MDASPRPHSLARRAAILLGLSIMGACTVVVFVVGIDHFFLHGALFAGPIVTTNTSSTSTESPKYFLSNGYSFTVTQQTMSVTQGEDNVLSLAVKDLPRFDDVKYANSDSGSPQYVFDISTPPIFDIQHQVIYLVVYDEGVSGNDNGSFGVISYSLNSKTATVFTTEYSSGVGDIELSPDGSLLVIGDGIAGGACSDTSWLDVYDTRTKTKLASVQPQQSASSSNVEFLGWKSDSSFEYLETILPDCEVSQDHFVPDAFILSEFTAL